MTHTPLFGFVKKLCEILQVGPCGFVLIFSQSTTSWFSWFFNAIELCSFFPQAIVFIIHHLLLEVSTNQGFSLSNFYSLMTFSFSLLHINRCSSLLSFSNFSWFVFSCVVIFSLVYQKKSYFIIYFNLWFQKSSKLSNFVSMASYYLPCQKTSLN
jgi:hypothetical protein